MCGHFPEGVATFEKKSIEGETKGDWYVRQMLGAANITGSPLMHLMTGNLSFQIEHHLFPDLPSNRYAEIAPQVKDIFERYDLPYAEGPLPVQVASAWKKVIRLSLPNDIADRTRSLPSDLVEKSKSVPGGLFRKAKSVFRSEDREQDVDKDSATPLIQKVTSPPLPLVA